MRSPEAPAPRGPAELAGVPLEPTRLRGAGVELFAIAAGPAGGEPVLLLHGFPEFWYGWRAQIPALARAGRRVVAPDQRGYGRSDAPAEIRDYRLEILSADALALADALGWERFHLVGHDWGAAVAWWTAATRPERLASLTVLNVPHPQVMGRALRRDPRQLLRSWYILFFQIPQLPEALLGARRARALARVLRSTSRPGTFGDAELERYRESWSRPGRIRAMLDWYRAMVRHPPRAGRRLRIAPPTLLIWGANDRALSRALVEPSLAMCDDGRLELFEEASHWVQHEEAERVNALLLDFITRHPIAAR